MASNHPAPLLSVVVAGRNDDYGGDFESRFFRSVGHNGRLLAEAGIDFEYILAEWNPIDGRELLSARFVAAFPWGRAVVIDSAIHRAHARNSAMPFFEMPAKNAAIRRARGSFILVTNADILFDDALVARIVHGTLDRDTYYRAHRIDVPPEIDWPELKQPHHQLLSSEGKLAPVPYLGSAGDFGLASRELWHSTTGLNETIRWTTRAKDWQFCLNLLARHTPIEFIGDVFHLDHASGFRNERSDVRDTSSAHFGGPWNFEFGLPSTNRGSWGLAECSATPGANKRITHLHCHQDVSSPEEDREDEFWRGLLAAPAEPVDLTTATLLHTLAVAPVRVVIRPSTPRSAVTAESLARVARHMGHPVDVDFAWPQTTTLTLPPDSPIDPASPSDWVLQETDERWSLATRADGALPMPHASLRAPANPRFNPLLARRLLRVWLRCHAAGLRRLALFGAGGHTREVLSWGLPDEFTYSAVLTSTGPAGVLGDLPVYELASFDLGSVDAIILSSTSFETDILRQLGETKIPLPVLPLYSDWPAGL